MQNNWHVASVWAGTEAVVSGRLRADLGLQVMWLRWVEQRRILGRPREVIRSLAPGYLFVEFDGLDAYAWHAVRDCGAMGFIGGEWPTAVPADAMKRLAAGCLAPDGLLPLPAEKRVLARVRAGDRVRLFGSYHGRAVATVTWVDGSGFRVTTEMFGRQMELYLKHGSFDLGLVEKIEGIVAPQYGKQRPKVFAPAAA